MEYRIEPRHKKGTRWKIGFLSEIVYNHYNSDDFHSDMMKGVFDAAQKYDVNIIRFSYYTSRSPYQYISQINMVLDQIEQFDLDGLLFMGWTKAASLDGYESFKKRFGSIPIFSIAAGFEDIPSVVFPGNSYVRELLIHLIKEHGMKRIAYLAPYTPDNRNDAYIDTLKEHGIYDPGLYVDEPELENLELNLRAKRCLEILLDERKMPFDAIISMYNNEAIFLLDELKKRGFNVPEDIAVASYEEGEMSKASLPQLTTIYFPWQELGYCSCERLVELLNNGHIPLTSIVPGKITYRNSCGCMPGTVNSARANNLHFFGKSLLEITGPEKKDIVRKMDKGFLGSGIDFNLILEEFLNDFKLKTGRKFLRTLEMQLRKVLDIYSDFQNIEDVISILRKSILPYVGSNVDEISWVEDTFQQAQVLVKETLLGIQTLNKFHVKVINQILQEMGQILIANFSIQSVMNTLEENLPRIDVPSCYIFLFKKDKEYENLFDHCSLAFEYCDHVRSKINEDKTYSAREMLQKCLFLKDRNYRILVHLLHVTDEFIGFVLFETGPMNEQVYKALAMNISTALRGAILLEELDDSYKKLVKQAHREGMADIATGVLHNVGNVLNSINSSIHVMKDMVNDSPVEDYVKACNLLEKNMDSIEHFICNDPKGKKLLQFYLRMKEAFTDQKFQLQYHINRLDDKVALINGIIDAQQSYAGMKSTMEELDIISVVEDVLKLNSSVLEKYKIKVIKDYKSEPRALVQRTKLFHILMNLIKNAKDAMTDISEEKRKLILTIYQDNNGKYIRITDTGCGIQEDLLDGIFSYGYTTKKNGHGFGLHSCANYMAEMKGMVWAESEGPGKGATFVLRFE